MPTELEELVGFIANPSQQIRLVAIENLVPYSLSQPDIFKADKFVPIKNLKLLVKDHPQIAEHVLTILINLSADREVLENLATDEKFLDTILSYVILPNEPNANLLSMLLANLAKWDAFQSILARKQLPPKELGSDDLVMNQLMDLFVKGAEGSYNKDADYDHLVYLFADLTKHAELRHYFVRKQDYDGVIPITKLKVFTEHKSHVRRKGVASTIKNVAFDVPSHPAFLAEDDINILPIRRGRDNGNAAGPAAATPDKERESDPAIIQTHLETLLLLTSTREARDLMRAVQVYPIVRELHKKVSDEGVGDACERLANMLMRDEEDATTQAPAGSIDEVVVEDDDDDDKVVEV
ncbi:hypothetical protein PG987_011955 [Apiospora arundinis]